MTDPTKSLYTLESRVFVPFKEFAGGYAGDHRGFGTTADASARIHGFVTLMPGTAAAAQKHAYSDTSFGPKLLLGGPGASNAIPAIAVNAQAVPGGARYTMHVSGSNPLVIGSPDIDSRARLTLTQSGDRLSVQAQLTGDRFPASEWTLRDAGGQSIFLGGHMPTKASDVYTKLFGDTDRPVGALDMTVTLNPDGTFKDILSAEYRGQDGKTVAGISGASLIQWNGALMSALTPPGMPAPEQARSPAEKARGAAEQARQQESISPELGR